MTNICIFSYNCSTTRAESTPYIAHRTHFNFMYRHFKKSCIHAIFFSFFTYFICAHEGTKHQAPSPYTIHQQFSIHIFFVLQQCVWEWELNSKTISFSFIFIGDRIQFSYRKSHSFLISLLFLALPQHNLGT